MVIVSICIPTFKQIEHLKKCVQSVLIQDYKNYELIITDDTPDDSVELMLKELLSDIPYQYYRNNPPLGSPQNWNFAISKAKGKYIKMLHHDDSFSQANSLSLMIEKIEKENSTFLFCESIVWNPKTNSTRLHKISDKYLKYLEKHPDFLFFKNVIGGPSATIHLNTNFIYDNRFKWLVDVDFYIQIISRSKKISFIQMPLVTTANELEGQITGLVQNDKVIQLKEHVLLFNKLACTNKKLKFIKLYKRYFDNLFNEYQISSVSDLLAIVPEAIEQRTFYEKIILDLTKFRKLKDLRKRFYESRYNRYIFKLEQYL
jgi:glycosyltransferase involved in cell wall biosynthesis